MLLFDLRSEQALEKGNLMTRLLNCDGGRWRLTLHLSKRPKSNKTKASLMDRVRNPALLHLGVLGAPNLASIEDHKVKKVRSSSDDRTCI